MNTLFYSMAGFALAASISPGPVNLLALSAGASHGLRSSMRHVTGATFGFTALLLAMGLGLQQLLQQWPVLTQWVAWFGVAFLLYMAYGLARADGQLSGNDAQQRPSLFKGALMQWLNPKAWLASMAGMGAYAAEGDLLRVGQFAALYFVICYLSISCWALAGVYLRQYLENPLYLRRFNRVLALLLVLSAVYLLV
ncbi:LysE family translocator [Pseudomonas sp. 32.2.56]|uniref:LysE family translocator n=1 Tax=Pseudomonas sp. 32.2.56 TaxID=2969303 RepID=UPI00215001F5|nr:LysE family translocator [Pseudomonas sp. 32.2.56]MCR4507876.1 LysE family translocator [Pseudomonas sp. 32.2.56]